MIQNNCLIPNWGTSTHDVIFEKICSELSLKKINLDLSFKIKAIFAPQILLLIIKLAPKIFLAIKKGDVRDLSIDQINIGKPINETVVTFSKYARFSFGKIFLWTLIDSIFIYIYIKNKIKKKEIALVLGGDDAYIYFSIPAQLAILNNLPVYFIRGQQTIYSVKFSQKYHVATFPYEDFKEILMKQYSHEKYCKYEENLNKRINGDKKSLPYMPPTIDNQWTNKIYEKNAFWIYLHDFYDSPGVFGENLFKDHFEWICFSVNYLKELNQKIYIKRHPNERPKNNNVIALLKSKFGDTVTWVEHDVPLIYISTTNPKAILTVYGSVITEANYLNIPTITTGRSRFCGFDITNRAKTIIEFKNFINQAIVGCISLKKRNDSVLAEYAAREFQNYYSEEISYPLNDISEYYWSFLGFGKYPPHHYLRREIFLYSDDFRSFYKKVIDPLHLTKLLKIDL